MWVCPKCKREFKRENQGHYCGKAPENVDEYIKLQSPEAKAHIEKLREIFKRCVPEISEQIAWSMPIYKKGGGSICFAACKNQISFYVDINVLENFRPQLSDFVIKKNAVYFPYNKNLPENVIENIIKQNFEIK